MRFMQHECLISGACLDVSWDTFHAQLSSLITMTHLFVSRGRDLAAYLNLLLFSRPFIVSLCALNQ